MRRLLFSCAFLCISTTSMMIRVRYFWLLLFLLNSWNPIRNSGVYLSKAITNYNIDFKFEKLFQKPKSPYTIISVTFIYVNFELTCSSRLLNGNKLLIFMCVKKLNKREKVLFKGSRDLNKSKHCICLFIDQVLVVPVFANKLTNSEHSYLSAIGTSYIWV